MEGNDRSDGNSATSGLNTTFPKSGLADPSAVARGSELLSLLLKKPQAQGVSERSKTPPVQPTISKEETARPLTPPARLPKHTLSDSALPARLGAASNRNRKVEHNGNRRVQRLPPKGVNGRRGENEDGEREGEDARTVEQQERRINELGSEVKEGTALESQQGPVARWRIQRSATPVDDRTLQNKPKGPDGTKGFAVGRGRPLNTPIAEPLRSILGEPSSSAGTPVGSRPTSADVSRPASADASQKHRRGNGQSAEEHQQRDLALQLKIAQMLVGREMESGGSSRGGERKRPSGDEEAPFAPPPSRQGSRRVEGSPSHGERAEVTLSSVDESGPISNPSVNVAKPGVSDRPLVRKEEPKPSADLQKLTQLLEGAFGGRGIPPGSELVARAADEWLETDLASARDKVSAALEKSIGAPGYGDLVDLEKHLKATLTELRRFRAAVEEGAVSSDRPTPSEERAREGKLEIEVKRLKYELGAAAAEVGRLEAELAFERTGGGVKTGPAEGGAERELERVRLELRAWQGEVEKLKGALERSEEQRQAKGAAASQKLQAKEAEFVQLQQELGTLRATAQNTEDALKRSLEGNRLTFAAELDRLREQITSDADEIGRLRAKNAAELEEVGRLRSQVASADVFFGLPSKSDRTGGRDAQLGGTTQQRQEGGVPDVLSQIFSKGPSVASSGMTWQQQDLARQHEAPSFQPSAPLRQPEVPASTQLTWQQQEMTRQQEQSWAPLPMPMGGHFVGPQRPPVLHETDLAFAHQQRQLTHQRHFQGGQFSGHPNLPSAPQFPRFPAPNPAAFWDNPSGAGGPSRPYSHLGPQPHPGQQRIGPFPQGGWQQPGNRGPVGPSLARTASAVEQELLGRTRSGPSAAFTNEMPIPVSVLLAAGRNAAKQPHGMLTQPATSEELGLIEDDEVIFRGR
ncbi:hypothetical protein KFL_002410080 [Klebsormidium nitens]|uniref:Uncharacterized protein n=1 Tax=Klebsormidium nitens TaxID=105231 RepID=A0A1Y1IA16_KLENI|nr:hypothetical protein KFL_002410080 [Klebsormidium nitens]|eukprot:GAQ85557.1 hypothetical protein KFL_002410080 [Klebsormidium nitens]